MQTAIGSLVSQGLYVLLQIVVLVALAYAGKLYPKLVSWFNTHTTAKQRDILHLVAQEAYQYAEVLYKNYAGADKLKYALQYVSDQLERKGIPFNIDAARAAVQKAWYEYEGQHKAQLQANQAAVAQVAASKPAPAPVAAAAQTAPTAAPAGQDVPTPATNTNTAQ